MSTRIILPKWGMGMEEGTVVRWLKAVGQKIEQGEPLVEIESAKATQELESPVSGTLVEILLPEGQTAPVNAEIALIEEHHL